MLLDLVHWMLGQVLADFGDDAFLHIGVDRTPQISECPWRRNNDQSLSLAFAHDLFHGRGNAPNEAVLLEFVPVGISDAATEVCAGALESAAGTIGALLMRGR